MKRSFGPLPELPSVPSLPTKFNKLGSPRSPRSPRNESPSPSPQVSPRGKPPLPPRVRNSTMSDKASSGRSSSGSTPPESSPPKPVFSSGDYKSMIGSRGGDTSASSPSSSGNVSPRSGTRTLAQNVASSTNATSSKSWRTASGWRRSLLLEESDGQAETPKQKRNAVTSPTMSRMQQHQHQQHQHQQAKQSRPSNHVDEDEDSGSDTEELLEFASSDNTQLYCWGVKGVASDKTPAPVLLTTLLSGESVVSIACGAHHVIMCTDLHRVWSWGKGTQGQLGHGDTNSLLQPKQIQGLDGKQVIRVAAGGSQTVAWSDSAKDVYAFGWSGSGHEKPRLAPNAIPRLHGLEIKDIAVGNSHCLACTKAGDMLTWGCNDLQQLGVGTSADLFIAVPVELDAVRRVSAVAAGDCTSACVTQGSLVFLWGSNWLKGKQGAASGKPVRVHFPRPIVTVALGDRHLLALANTGEVFGIGNNELGQLGNTKGTWFSDPVVVTFPNSSEVASQQAPSSPPSLELMSKTGHNTSSSRIMTKLGTLRIRGASRRDLDQSSNVPMLTISCGPGFSMTLSKEGHPYFFGSAPWSKDVSAPGLVPELASVCCGKLSCGSSVVACLVDLQNSADMKFQSFNPPILRCATLSSALEFMISPKGAQSPLLSYMLEVTWPTFCDESELLSSVQWLWSERVDKADESTRARLEAYLHGLCAENQRRLGSSSISNELIDWLSDAGQMDCVKLLKSASSGTAIPSSQSSSAAAVGGGGGVAAVDLFSFTPEAIAEQLTLVDWSLLAQVHSSELIGQGWTKRDKDVLAPNVLAFVGRFNCLSDFVRGDILLCPDMASRNRRLRLWLDVQKQCFNLNNFNCCFSINAAVQSVPLFKLMKHDLLEMTKSHKRWLDYFNDNFLSSNKKGYRKKISELVAKNESGVLFLGCSMADLVFIQDGNPDTLDGGLINFWKRYQMARTLHQVRHFKQGQSVGALKRDPVLFPFLRQCKSDLDDKKCDDLVDGIVKNATLSPQEPEGPRFVPIEVSPAGSSMMGSLHHDRDRVHDPEKRLEVLSVWVSKYIELRDEFSKVWVKSQALDDCIDSFLCNAMQPQEEPLLETLLVYVLAPGTNVRVLIELIKALAVTEPSKDVRDSVVSLCCAFKMAPATPILKDQVNKLREEEVMVHLEEAVKQWASGVRKVVAQLEHLVKSKDAIVQLKKVYDTSLPHTREELEQFKARLAESLEEREQFNERSKNDLKAAARKLEEAQAREAELRRLLAQAVGERQSFENEVDRIRELQRGQGKAFAKKIDILCCNISSAEQDIRNTELVLKSLEDSLQLGPHAAALAADVSVHWQEGFDSNVKALESLLSRIYERFVDLQGQVGGLAALDQYVGQVDQACAMFEKCKVLSELLRNKGLTMMSKSEVDVKMAQVARISSEVFAIKEAVKAVM